MQGVLTPTERHEGSAPASRRKMKKQVSFSEQEPNDHPGSPVKTWRLQPRADRRLATGLATRSACYYQTPKYPASESKRSYNVKHGQRIEEISQAALHQRSEQQVRNVHIPKSMLNSSFLKHPDLTIGQRRYLWSIAKIYSTTYMQTCLNRQYPTWSCRHRKQDSQSQKGTASDTSLVAVPDEDCGNPLSIRRTSYAHLGIKICHENQMKLQYLHQRQSQSETRKMPSKRLTSSLAAASRAYEPKEKKERLQSGALLKDRNKLQNLKSKKRKMPKQKEQISDGKTDLSDELGSFVNGNVPEHAALNKSMKAMSLKDEEGVLEELGSKINEENEDKDSTGTLANTESTEKEKKTEGQQEDTAETE